MGNSFQLQDLIYFDCKCEILPYILQTRESCSAKAS